MRRIETETQYYYRGRIFERKVRERERENGIYSILFEEYRGIGMNLFEWDRGRGLIIFGKGRDRDSILFKQGEY